MFRSSQQVFALIGMFNAIEARLGFGSNGVGGISTGEVSEALQSMYYALVAENHGRAQEPIVTLDEEALSVLQRIASAVVAASAIQIQRRYFPSINMNRTDANFRNASQWVPSIKDSPPTRDNSKRDPSSIRLDIMKSLTQPFERLDAWGRGSVTFRQYKRGLLDLCAIDSRDVGNVNFPNTQELRRLADFFESSNSLPNERPHRVRPRVSSRVARALNKVDIDQYLKRQGNDDFISRDLSTASRYQYLDELSSDTDSDSSDDDSPPINVDYYGFCRTLLRALVDVRRSMKEIEARKKQVKSSSATSWLLREYELLENLIGQLMGMEPRRRRKVLMKLSHSLISLEQEFHTPELQDSHQVYDVDGFNVLKLLSGAGFNFERISRVQLLRSIEELGGVMNFSELSEILFKSCFHWSDDEKSIIAKVVNAMGPTVVDRRRWLAKFKHRLSQVFDGEKGKPVSWSDHIKRKGNKAATGKYNPMGVYLDSNDPDKRLADGIAPSEFLRCLRDCGVFLDVAEEAALLDCLDAEFTMLMVTQRRNGRSLEDMAPLSSPKIHVLHYESFLLMCSRHVGHWSDAFPELNEYLRKLVTSVDNPIQHIIELGQLLNSFSDRSDVANQIISERGFMISCSRSRLLSDLPADLLKKISNVLSDEDDSSGGKIDYGRFLIYLEVLSISTPPAIVEDQAETVATLLLSASIDSKKSLRPLRSWLCKHVDVDSKTMSENEILAMLRHFKVPHKHSDLLEILQDVHRVRALEQHKSYSYLNQSSFEVTTKMEASASDFVRYLNFLRGDIWKTVLPQLCSKIFRFLSLRISAARSRNVDLDTVINDRDSALALKAARALTAKLRGFSKDFFIDVDIFQKILQMSGILLLSEDIDALADGTDVHPAGQRVRYTVITEAVIRFLERDSNQVNKWMDALKMKLQSAAEAANRLEKDVAVEVCSAIKGFDPEGLGIISKDDFLMALRASNLVGYEDVSRLMPESEFVPYGSVLEYITRSLTTPTTSESTNLKSAEQSPENSPEHKEPSFQASDGNATPPLVVELWDKVRISILSRLKSPVEDEIWNLLLEVFCVYDVDESYYISSKDFIKGLSVLLAKGGTPYSSAWEEICAYYASKSTYSGSIGASMMRNVDYLIFCDDVVKACLSDRKTRKSSVMPPSSQIKRERLNKSRLSSTIGPTGRNKHTSLLKTY